MRKILLVIFYIVVGLFVVGVIISLFSSGVEHYFTKHPVTITKQKTVIVGPYTCGNGNELKIQQEFNVNTLEGVVSRLSTRVTYASTTFNAVESYRGDVEKNTGLIFKYDQYEKYLKENQRSSQLPSQEELIARNIQPRENGMVSIGTTDPMSSQEFNAFIQCFSDNKKNIYDSLTSQIEKKRDIPYTWFVEAYVIKLSKESKSEPK